MTDNRAPELSLSESGSAFRWYRDAAGYRLEFPTEQQGGTPRASQVLLAEPDGVVVRRGGALEPYSPRATDVLHRRFAALKDDPEEILSFLSEAGPLGISEENPKAIERESLAAIKARRDELKSVLAAADEFYRLERKLKKAAKEHFEATGRVAARDPGEVRQILGGLFNQWVTPRMTVRLTRATSARGQATLALTVVPRTLLSFMWLQAAEEIQGNARWRLCEECHGPIPEGAREDKVTCSDRCRKALSIKRLKERQATPAPRAKRAKPQTRTKRKSR